MAGERAVEMGRRDDAATAANRRAHLPTDVQAAAAARAVVRDALAAAGLGRLADEAAMLATELTTVSVALAGSALELQVSAGVTGVTVTLTDRSGVLRSPSPASIGVADGRPAFPLVDALASAWGLTHDRHGKSVWFRLDAEPVAAPAEPPGTAVPDGRPAFPPSAADAAAWLTSLPDRLLQELTPTGLVQELLHRVCESTGARWGAVWLETGDGAAPTAIATVGLDADAAPESPARLWPGDPPNPRTAQVGVPTPALAAAGAARSLSVALPLTAPTRGRLELAQAPDARPTDATFALLVAERMAVSLDASRVRDTEQRRRGDLAFLADASELLASSLDVDLALALVAQLCVPRVGQWCVIHSFTAGAPPELVVAVHADERAVPALERAFLGPEAGPVLDRVRAAVRDRAPVPLNGAVSGIVLPLTARREVVGAMTVGDPAGRRHTPEEIAIAADLARRAAVAVDNARLYSERDAAAQALQRALLPASLPQPAGLEFAAEYSPAGEGDDVGGDFYDVMDLDDGWLLAIGDVCGKGPEAASVTGMVRTVLRTLMREGRDLRYALGALNLALLDQGHLARFCTVAVALARRRGDRVHVRLCVAGHPPPVLLGAAGVEFVGVSGMAVGLAPEMELEDVEVVLGPGDALVFFTDGVTERRRGLAQFGEENVLAALAPCVALPATEVAARLRAAATEFGTGPLRDDLAILVLAAPR